MDKQLTWVGSAFNDLLAFPAEARRQAGFALRKIQAGHAPDDWKSFEEIGPGTREIRIRASDSAFRLLYVAKFDEAVYVLHCFQKTTQTTSTVDKRIAKTRYRAVVTTRKNGS